MIKLLRQRLRFSLVRALVLLVLVMGCGSASDSDPEDDPGQNDINFSGTWKMSEEWTGCGNSLDIQYVAEITQEGSEAQLKIGDNTMACSVDGDQLVCSGELQLSIGAYRDFEEIFIRFEDESQMSGKGNWMLYSADIGSCSGSSVFYLSQDTALDFSGNWDIHEAWRGCSKSGVLDYSINIKQSGAEATLFIDNRSMDCTVNEDELSCTGERYYENGTYDDFSEYILRFGADGRLEGQGSWTYHGTGGSACSGTSVFSLNNDALDELDEVNFEGIYELFLDIDDCDGYRAAEEAETYVILQDGINATFERIGDPSFHFQCQVIRGDLQCGSEVITTPDSNAFWEISQVTFSYDSRNDLKGVATGISYAEDGSDCPGTYSFSAISSVSEPTASFIGTWDVTESLLGCKTSLTADYTIEIVDDGENTILDFRGEIFNCAIENNELICAGIFQSGTSSSHFEYSEYRLWFNENNDLDGIARWTLHDGTNAVCIGNSVMAATSVPVGGS